MVKSADRVMAVLDLVAERGALPFSEIAEALALPKSSAHSLLRTMERRGYVALDADRRYALGSHVWELGQAVPRVEDLRTLLRPLMDEAVRRTGETVQLATLDGVSAVYLALSESPHPVKLTSRAGVRLPAHTSAIGKALLAELDPTEAARRFKGAHLARQTDHTIASVPKLLAELDRTRDRGYAVDNEEFAIGLRCIGVPIRDVDERPVAAISASMPTPRYSRAAAANARAALADAQAGAAAALGHWEGRGGAEAPDLAAKGGGVIGRGG